MRIILTQFCNRIKDTPPIMAAKQREVVRIPLKFQRQPEITPGLVVGCLLFTVVCVLLALRTFPQYPSDDEFTSLGNPEDQGTGTTTSGSPESPFCTNEDRVERVRVMCQNNDWETKPSEMRSHFYRMLLADDEHKLLYCVIPEVASTSMKTLLARSSSHVGRGQAIQVHNEHFLRAVGLRYLDEYDTKEIKSKLANYHKFMIVMDPLRRLNATFHPQQFAKKHHSRAIKKLLSKMPPSPGGIPPVKFNQFLELLVTGGIHDSHWTSYYELCHPCDIAYDHILKIESLERDLEPIMSLLWGSPANQTETLAVSLNQLELNRARNTRVDLSSIDLELVSKILQLYQKDMDLFGYNWSYLYGTSCNNGSLKNSTCC